MKIKIYFSRSVCMLQLLIFFGIGTVKVLSQDAIENLHQNEDDITSLPYCTLEFCKPSQTGDISMYILNLIETINSTECVSLGNINERNFSKSVRCTEKTITVNLERDTLLKRIRINCSDTSPLDFSNSLVLPFAGIDVLFNKSILPRGQLLHEISAKFPEILDVYNEGLQVYSGYYAFTRKDPPLNLTFKLNITNAIKTSRSTTEVKAGVPKGFCLEVSEDRATCNVDYTEHDLYLVNIGGKNPWTTRFLQSCLQSNLTSCGNKISGTTCVTGRYCKKISPIHQNGLIRCSANNYTEDVEYFRDIYAELHQNEEILNWKNSSLVVMIQDEDKKTRMELPDPLEDGSEDDYTNTITNKENDTNNDNKTCPKTRATGVPYQQKLLELYDQNDTYFECHYLNYFLVTPAVWYIGWANGSKTEFFRDYGSNTTDEERYGVIYVHDGKKEGAVVKVKSSHVIIQASLGMRNISCELWYWNSSDISEKAVSLQTVNVKESRPPMFEQPVVEHEERTRTLTLRCLETQSMPPDRYTWTHDGKDVPDSAVTLQLDNATQRNASVLRFSHVGNQHSGKYTCTTKNFRDEARKTFNVTVNNGENVLLTVAITLIVIIVVLVLTLAGLYRLYMKQRAQLSKHEIKEFKLGNKSAIRDNDYAHSNAKHMPYDANYELAWNQFQMDQQKELGKGVHGVVYKGVVLDGNMPIAVKTLKTGVEKEVLKALLDELKIMIYLGNHDYIVELKGACTEFLNEGRAYVLVEFCSLGSLQTFIENNRDSFQSSKAVGNYVNTGPTNHKNEVVNVSDFTLQDLILWSAQIAKGMQYLEEKKVIHGDLAIRNVLLKSKDMVKLTDFGLSRQLIDTDTYVKKQQGLLPWRYMAIEAMRSFQFTSKSDVWSYGVTLWEMYTLGAVPYPGMTWSPDFMQLLEDNMRLYKPKHATDDLYKIMLQCWAPEPEGRPNFKELSLKIANLLE